MSEPTWRDWLFAGATASLTLSAAGLLWGGRVLPWVRDHQMVLAGLLVAAAGTAAWLMQASGQGHGKGSEG